MIHVSSLYFPSWEGNALSTHVLVEDRESSSRLMLGMSFASEYFFGSLVKRPSTSVMSISLFAWRRAARYAAIVSDVTSQEALSELSVDRNLEGNITGSRFLPAKLMAAPNVVAGAALFRRSQSSRPY